MIKKRISLAILLIVLSLVTFPKPAYAADFSYKIKSEYKIAADKKTSVRTVIEVENNSDTPVGDELVLPVSGTEIADIEATLQDGQTTKASYSEEKRAITIDTKAGQTGAGAKWSLSLNYDVSIVQKLGQTTIFQIAPQNYGDLAIASEIITISAHLDLGLAKPRGPEPTTTNTGAEQQILTWVSDSGPQTSAIGLLYGEIGVTNVTLSSELANEGWWWKTVTYTLPPDTNQQQVFIESISPKPSAIRLDTDGNILADYRLRPKQKIQVTAKAKIAVNNFTYTTTDTATKSEIPQDIIDTYTSFSGVWKESELDIEIEDDQPVIDTIRAVYSEVVKETKDDQPFEFEASKVTADSLVSGLRTQGIPARTVLGMVFADGGDLFTEPKQHAWVEAYSPGVGWMTLDPIFQKKGDYFGTSDVQRIGFVLRGVNDEYPPEGLNGVAIEFTDEDMPEIPDMKPILSAVNYMILPGLAITQIKTEMPGGVIVDGATLNNGGTTIALGSLAPLQIATTRALAFGGEAFASKKIEYGIGDAGSDISVQAETTSKVSYIPMVILLGLLALIILIKGIRYRRNRSHKPADTPSSEDIDDSNEDDLLASDDQLNDLVMTFSDEKKEKEDTAEPGNPPYINLDGTPQTPKPIISENPPKDDILPKKETTVKSIPITGAATTPQRRRKPPRLIQ